MAQQTFVIKQQPPFQVYELITVAQGNVQVEAADLEAGPTGPTGPAGPPGVTGPTGPAGVSPSPQLAQLVNVSKAGNDATGDGSQLKPFLTIPAAMAAIASYGDASPTKRYGVLVTPGNYAESFVLPANVFVIGEERDITRLTGATITLNDPSWTPAGDHRSGLQSVVVTGGAKVFDFNAASSNEGKLFFRNTSFSQTPVWSAFSNVNQVQCDDCLFFAGFTQNNCTAIYTNCSSLNGGAIVMQGLAAHSLNAGFYGGATDGPVTFAQGSASPTPCELDFFGFQMQTAQTLTLDGAALVVLANPGSLPKTIALSGGATSPRPTVAGSKGGNAALASLLTALVNLGLLDDTTT